MLYQKFCLRGVVQGVGFRTFVCEHAQRIGVCGWVRNDPDGGVTVVASGDETQLAELQVRLRCGPAGSRVAACETTTASDAEAAMIQSHFAIY